MYHAYIAGPVPFPVGAMLTTSAEGAFYMLVGSREEIEKRVEAAAGDPDISVTQLL